MGVSGAGKSTVASTLAGRFGLVYVDGDELHPLANVAKMRSGVPLDDADRWPWLDLVAATLRSPNGAVLACSALKRAYRDRIRGVAPPTGLRFVFLDIAAAEVAGRVQGRSGHFMPPTLIGSQFAALERPEGDEADVLTVAAGRSVHDIADEISRRFAAVNETGARQHG